ncbi:MULTISPECIES: hypothetical protein [Nocardia]|uniref:hypothetical protein n=1 Tax=Nocardia TaxID=1817 RepID=UPI002458B808|nr:MULTISPECIES: hypothetical protein [Nocardia]
MPEHTENAAGTAANQWWTATAKDADHPYGDVIFSDDATTLDAIKDKLAAHIGVIGASMVSTWTEIIDDQRRYGYNIISDGKVIATAVIEGEEVTDHPAPTPPPVPLECCGQPMAKTPPQPSAPDMPLLLCRECGHYEPDESPS